MWKMGCFGLKKGLDLENRVAQLYQEFTDPGIFTVLDMTESLTFTDLTISMIPSGTRTAIRSRCIHTYGFLVAIMNTSHALVIVVTPRSVSFEAGFTAAGVRTVCISAHCVEVARISGTLVYIITLFSIAFVSVVAITVVGSLGVDALCI